MLSELRAICRKDRWDPVWIVNVFWRPVSIYFTWAAIKLRMQSNTVTGISLCSAVASSLLTLWPSVPNYIAATVLMQVFLMLDHVDGETARYYSALREGPRRDFSGPYFDRISHYFHGSSLYFCLGAGLFRTDGNLLWLLLGMAGAIGSCGLPRFVACYELLGIALTNQNAAVLDFAQRKMAYYAAYGPTISGPRDFYIVPRTKEELLIAGRQWLTFPGFLFIFAAAVAAAVVWPADLWPIKVYLVFYALVLLANTVFATRAYLKVLSNVPTE
jgi:hypothetical protein